LTTPLHPTRLKPRSTSDGSPQQNRHRSHRASAEDRWIRRDDDAANLPEWPFEDANIHAIQWYGEAGEIEFEERPKPPNESFTDSAILDPYLSALDAYLATVTAEQDTDVNQD
jgi:hypothetical protein